MLNYLYIRCQWFHFSLCYQEGIFYKMKEEKNGRKSKTFLTSQNRDNKSQLASQKSVSYDSHLKHSKILSSSTHHQTNNYSLAKIVKRIGAKKAVSAYYKQLKANSSDYGNIISWKDSKSVINKQNNCHMDQDNAKIISNSNYKKVKRIGRRAWVTAYRHQIIDNLNEPNCLDGKIKEMEFLKLPALYKQQKGVINVKSSEGTQLVQQSTNVLPGLQISRMDYPKEKQLKKETLNSINQSSLKKQHQEKQRNSYINLIDSITENQVNENKNINLQKFSSNQSGQLSEAEDQIKQDSSQVDDIKEFLNQVDKLGLPSNLYSINVLKLTKKKVSEISSMAFSVNFEQNIASEKSNSDILEMSHQYTQKVQNIYLDKEFKDQSQLKRKYRNSNKQSSQKTFQPVATNSKNNIRQNKQHIKGYKREEKQKKSMIKKPLPPAYPFNCENRPLSESINSISNDQNLSSKTQLERIKQIGSGVIDMYQEDKTMKNLRKSIHMNKDGDSISVYLNKSTPVENINQSKQHIIKGHQVKSKGDLQGRSHRKTITKSLHTSSLPKTSKGKDRKLQINKCIQDARKELKSLHHN